MCIFDNYNLKTLTEKLLGVVLLANYQHKIEKNTIYHSYSD